MNRLGVNVSVERSISQGTSKLPNYYLNDQLFARYQERIAYHLSGLAATTMASATWRSAGDAANEQQLSKIMAEAKRRARIDVLKEAGGGATAQTTAPAAAPEPTARPSFQQVRERFSQPLAPVMP